jgi:hypothetical protein
MPRVGFPYGIAIEPHRPVGFDDTGGDDARPECRRHDPPECPLFPTATAFLRVRRFHLCTTSPGIMRPGDGGFAH